ncbi:MAG TPA: hypothetical protein VMT46_12650 [Anaerolineaceae bacterium]|nr:hypothetical protein [Anaerolineaceae bacterium]
MRTNQDVSISSTRLQRIALIVGLLFLVIGIVGGVLGNLERFFQSYLLAFMFWLGIGLGSLAFLLLHYLTGSRWGLAVRRITEAGAGTLWLLAILFIPLLFDLPAIFQWARPGATADPVIQLKSPYLNVPSFIVRAVIYFAIWIALALITNRRSARWSETEDPQARSGMQGWGAFGLILYGLTMTFASVDWMMSLEPYWHSAIFGLITIMGQVMSGLCFAVIVLILFPGLGLGRRWNFRTTPVPYQDLGALMLALVMAWAYLAYFQLLIIWAGNLPREVAWYYNRSRGGWLGVGAFVGLFQFCAPFLILLSKRIRHNLRLLAPLSALILVTYLVNLYWQIIPAFHPGQFSLHWLDIVLPIGLGGLWFATFLAVLKRRPALREEEQKALLAPEYGSEQSVS